MIHKTHRFHGRKSLGFVFKRGQVVHGPYTTLKYAYNQRTKQYRVAIVISRKISKSAVVRNRIRRRIYEAVREVGLLIDKPYDLVFLVREAELADIDSMKLRNTIHGQLKKAKVLTGGGSQSVNNHDIVMSKEKNT